MASTACITANTFPHSLAPSTSSPSCCSSSSASHLSSSSSSWSLPFRRTPRSPSRYASCIRASTSYPPAESEFHASQPLPRAVNVLLLPLYLDERFYVSRRHSILATLVSTLPSVPLFQSQKTVQALAVEDEMMKMDLIRYELRKVLSKGKAAGILRLAFHDAGTFDSADDSGGMNGSILYELERPENTGLKRSIKVLQKVKFELDLAFPVSWADLIAVAGAQAVAECDGPVIPVKLGRLDSSGPDPEGKMPEETLSVGALKQAFQTKGFTTQELVVLSGAHTIGNKGFGNPNLFDNSYFQILLQKPWKIGGPDDAMTSMIGLATDRALSDDNECLEWLRIYAGDQGRFFTDFSAAYLKLVGTGARWETL